MINISAEDAKLFEANGFSKEKVGATIEHYRKQGLSDDDIQLKINDKLSSFGKAPAEEKKGIDLTPRGIGQTVGNALSAPIVAMRDNIPVDQAFAEGQQRIKDFNKEKSLASKKVFIINRIGDIPIYSNFSVGAEFEYQKIRRSTITGMRI